MKMQIETDSLTPNEQDLFFRIAKGNFVFCEDCALCDKTYPHTWQCPNRMASVSEGDYCESGWKKLDCEGH